MERKITLKGKPFALEGPGLKAGDRAPDFALVDSDLKEFALKDFKGKVKLISVAVSLDTSVCDQQLRRLNQQAASFSKDVVVLNVTMDLPFAIKRFCANAGIERALALSDYRTAAFGRDYGVLIRDLRLLARSVFIADSSDSLAYVEIVPESTNNVNFEEALKNLKELVSRGKAA